METGSSAAVVPGKGAGIPQLWQLLDTRVTRVWGQGHVKGGAVGGRAETSRHGRGNLRRSAGGNVPLGSNCPGTAAQKREGKLTGQ